MMGPAGSTQREEAGDSKLVLGGGGGGGGGGAKKEEEEAVTVEWLEGLVFPHLWLGRPLSFPFPAFILFLGSN